MSKVESAPPCGGKIGARWTAQPAKGGSGVEFKCMHCGRIADLPERMCEIGAKVAGHRQGEGQ